MAHEIMGTGRPETEAREQVEEAYKLAIETSDSRRAVIACQAGLTLLIRSASTLAPSLPTFQTWVRRVEAHTETEASAVLIATIGESALAWVEGRWDDFYSACDRALAMARGSQSREAIRIASFFPAKLSAGPSREQARFDLLDQLCQDPWSIAPANSLAAIVKLANGDRPAAERLWSDVETFAERSHDPITAVWKHLNRSVRSYVAGDLDDVLESADTLASTGIALGTPLTGRQFASIAAFRTRVYRGDTDGALADLDSLAESAGVVDALPYIASQRALAHAFAGDIDRARTQLIDLERRFLDSGRGEPAAIILWQMLEAAVLAQLAELCDKLAELLAPMATLLSTWPDVTSIGRHLGGAAALSGRRELSRSHFEGALRLCAQVGFRVEAALTGLQLAELLGCGTAAEQAEALEHLHNLIPELEALGLQPALNRALLLAEALTPSNRETRRYPDGLSEREVEVLRLLAEGLSNQEIADRLVIARNTVIRHVSNIFAKSAVANRAEAVSYAHQRHLV